MVEFEAAVRGGASILTDGGIETRIMFETEIEMDPHVGVATLVGDQHEVARYRTDAEASCPSASPKL